MIESLPRLTPDPVRASKLRALCHDRLARQRRKAGRKARRSTVERTAVAAFAAIYVVAIAANALSVYAMF
jgi:hypothetical protein